MIMTHRVKIIIITYVCLVIKFQYLGGNVSGGIPGSPPAWNVEHTYPLYLDFGHCMFVSEPGRLPLLLLHR